MRKCALPPELATLTDGQLAQVDAWLDRFTYAKVQALFLEAYQTPIGLMKLARYNARRLKARALSHGAAAGESLTAAHLVALKNGAPIPDARFNKELLLRRTLQMVPAVKNAFHLRELHQIATYEERRVQDERRLALEHEFAEIRLRRADLRERELALKRQAAAARPSPKRQAAAATRHIPTVPPVCANRDAGSTQPRQTTGPTNKNPLNPPHSATYIDRGRNYDSRLV